MPGNVSPDDDWSIDSDADEIAFNCVASTIGHTTEDRFSVSAAAVVLEEKGDKPSGVIARTADEAKGMTRKI
ncbi:hypothetical protein PF003_g14311 [Phytophthora fragariae]|nr:hypothetical protein PF003_g14311 [Phytophthora fragariae]